MAKKKLYNTNGIVYSTDLNFKPEEETVEQITLPIHEQLLKIKWDAKHRGGKMVTIIEGFTGSQKDLDILGKLLKAHCATGGSIKNNEIIIQGDNREKIMQWLTKTGYKKAKII
jgi:translation initiation factor 1